MAPITDKRRHQAVQRALKMNILFKEQYYDGIIGAINMPADTDDEKTARRTAFDRACPAEPVMNEAERDWLWNYLQHGHETTTDGNPGGWDNVREAMGAAVGW